MATQVQQKRRGIELMLAEDVPSLGKQGELVQVRPGYARNYLLPQGLATVATAGAKRMVHISSTAVYGIPDHHPLLETDTLHGVGPYGIAKIEAESDAASFAAEDAQRALNAADSESTSPPLPQADR